MIKVIVFFIPADNLQINLKSTAACRILRLQLKFNFKLRTMPIGYPLALSLKIRTQSTATSARSACGARSVPLLS